MSKDSGLTTAYKSRMDVALRKVIRSVVRTSVRTSARTPVTFPVIIQFKQKVTSAQLQTIRNRVGASSFKIKRRLPLINAISARVTHSCVKKICEMESIQRVYLNRKAKVSLDIATPAVGSSALQKAGLTGQGITIAVLDTGIFLHPDLKNRVIGFKDFINNRQVPYDDNGHGTHVAGCAAGNGNRSSRSKRKFIGTASEANIVAVKVLNQEGLGSFDDIIAGIDWTIKNRKRYGIRILNLSVVATAFTSCSNDPLCQAIEKAVKAGIVTVVCAGNSGPAPNSITTPGISPFAISVGAADDRNSKRQSDDTIADFSSRGPTIDGLIKPDLVAPGVDITSLRVPGSLLDIQNPHLRVGRWYFTLSGCSMATPIVSGAVAQLLQWQPSLTPHQVKELLTKHAVNLGFDPNTQGSGEVDVRFLLSKKTVCKTKKK